jgi:hypothetical protein
MDGIRLQSSLGKAKEDNRKDLDMGGVLMMGEVLKVYPKYHTADVKLVNRTYGTLVSSSSTYGKLSCKIMESFAGYDEELGVAFGKASPIQKGCTVIVGYVGNKKAQPVILGCVHNPEILKNNLVEYQEDDAESAEKWQKYQIFMNHLQDYFFMNKNGEIELSSHSKSFIKFSEDELDDSRDTGFTSEDLTIWDKLKGTPLYQDEEKFKSFSLLAVLQDKFDKATSAFLRLLVNGRQIRLSKDTDETLVFIELDEDNNFRIKQQFDTPERDESNQYTELKLDFENQKIQLIQNLNSEVTQIEIQPDSGILIKSSKSVELSSTKDVKITSAESVDITAKDINIQVSGGEN